MSCSLSFFFLVSLSTLFHLGHCRVVLDSSSSSSSEDAVQDFRVVPHAQLNVLSGDTDSSHPFELGQIGGLASCVKNPNRLLVFHRGKREWTAESFPDGRNFDKKSFGVIHENTLLTVNTKTSQLVSQWGNDTFYMPHGLSVDSDGNWWLTDVALHQVFKYDGSSHERLLTLGEAFVPGSDEKHLCKPTDAAVSSEGNAIFVADGYCNSRVVKFDRQGTYLTQFEMPQDERPLSVPHSLVLLEQLDTLCVADRENGRIVCFDAGLDDKGETKQGDVLVTIEHPQMDTVYAITYDPNNHRLYAVSGGGRGKPAMGFTFSTRVGSFGQLLTTWQPSHGFAGSPHDVAVSINGRSVFVGEIGTKSTNRIDSFTVLN